MTYTSSVCTTGMRRRMPHWSVIYTIYVKQLASDVICPYKSSQDYPDVNVAVGLPGPAGPACERGRQGKRGFTGATGEQGPVGPKVGN